MAEIAGLTASGTCDAKFTSLRRLFEHLLRTGEEAGAALAVYLDGRLVVDLWGGAADPAGGRPWQRDTIVATFSVTKALVSTMGHMLVDRGLVDLDQPVARYWPAFGQAGKDGILVRHLFEHRAGLAFVDRRLQPGDLYDWPLMMAAIEQSRPTGPVGAAPVYHNMTFGYLLGGLIEQVTGKRLGRFNRDELCGPLGLDYNIALTAAEKARCATILQKTDPAARFRILENGANAFRVRTLEGFGAGETFNSEAWRSGELGSGQGHGNARAIAGLFECLRAGGSFNGRRIMRPETRDRAVAFRCESDGIDPVLGSHLRLASGYELNCEPFPMGPNPRAFGHWGAGGAFGLADIDAGIAFGYTPNLMHDKLELGPRGTALVRETFAAL